MFGRSTSLRCENLPVLIAGETIYVDREEITAQDLLNRLERVLNNQIDTLRNEGCPLQKVADLLVLQDVMLEKDLDRADDMIVYLLARPGCNFDIGLYARLQEIGMAVVRNELTADQLFSLWYSVAFHRWSDEKQDFQHIDNFKDADKPCDSAQEVCEESKSAS